MIRYYYYQHHSTSNCNTQRRGTALFIVFIIVASAVLLTTSLAFHARAERFGASTEDSHAKAAAVAWSGVQAVMAELDQQRVNLLNGIEPQLTDSWSLFGDGTQRGVVDLLPIGSDEELVVSESAKVDLNAVDQEQLLKLTGLSQDIVGEILSTKRQLPNSRFESLGDLIVISGIDASHIWGDPADTTYINMDFSKNLMSEDQDAVHVSDDSNAIATNSIDIRGHATLSQLLTVFAYEPKLQESGKYKININDDFTDRMFRRIEQRFGQDLANLIKRVKENDDSFHLTEQQVYQLLATGDTDPTEWDQYLDAFTDNDDRYYQGRIDILNAPAHVLQTLDGISNEQAIAIVDERQVLTQKQRAGTAWLVTHDILTPDEWAIVAPKLTWRTTAWRVLVRGRVVVGGENRKTRIASERIYEAVIDLSMPRPRIAYLRDVTMLSIANRFYSSSSKDSDVEDSSIADVENDERGMFDTTIENNSGASPFRYAGDGRGFDADESAYDISDDTGVSNENVGEEGSAETDRNSGRAESGKTKTPIGRWNRGSE